MTHLCTGGRPPHQVQIEPLARHGFNAIAPKDPADKIVSSLTRWRAWADHIINCRDDQALHDFDMLIQQSHHAIFEMIRAAEPAYEEKQIFYSFYHSSPFDLPSVKMTGLDRQTFRAPLEALTKDGRKAIGCIIPSAMMMKRTISDFCHTIRLSTRTFGGSWWGSGWSDEQIKSNLSPLGVEDYRPLVRRLPRTR